MATLAHGNRCLWRTSSTRSGSSSRWVDGVEQIVLEQGGLLGQGEEEEPGLGVSGGDHNVLDHIE